MGRTPAKAVTAKAAMMNAKNNLVDECFIYSGYPMNIYGCPEGPVQRNIRTRLKDC